MQSSHLPLSPFYNARLLSAVPFRRHGAISLPGARGGQRTGFLLPGIYSSLAEQMSLPMATNMAKVHKIFPYCSHACPSLMVGLGSAQNRFFHDFQ